MLYVLHGENIVASRDFILALKKSQKAHLLEFKSSETTISQILTSYFTSDLFGQKTAVVVDVTSDKSFDFKSLLESLKKGKSENDLVFFSSKVFGKTHYLLKEVGTSKPEESGTLGQPNLSLIVKEFKEELKPNVFNFLDALFAKQKTNAYKEFNSLTKSGVDEFEIFTMILFGLRNLSFALFDSSALAKLHPFVKNKTVSQAKKFRREEVSKIYDFLYMHDLQVKTGKGSLDVTIPLLIEKLTLTS